MFNTSISKLEQKNMASMIITLDQPLSDIIEVKEGYQENQINNVSSCMRLKTRDETKEYN